jgi:glycosyltransferase involved in cell wall biosynthesis
MPKVTIITPNYNHARYLARRLDSILAQSFRDFELIVLDDASTDNSREVIAPYLHDARVRTIFNERTSGSAYKQWNLGLRRATGEYVWIAESDDYAEPTLLETLVDRLDRHPSTGLAMCQSWIVDDEDRILFDNEVYLRLLKICERRLLSRWKEDFVADGQEFCRNYLYPYNSIANASAVVFRRCALEAVKGAPDEMKIFGDWMTYVNVLLRWDIAFVSAHLNFFRRHGATCRMQTPRDIALRELRAVHRRINDSFGLGDPDRVFLARLPMEVGFVIGNERRPPYNKVPARKSLELLRRFAGLDARAFLMALRLLGRERAADLARRVGLLALARGVIRSNGCRR